MPLQLASMIGSSITCRALGVSHQEVAVMWKTMTAGSVLDILGMPPINPERTRD
jgi:hypothetical protein